MIDGPELDGNSGRRQPVESSIFSFIIVSRGVPCAHIILELTGSLWPFSMTSYVPDWLRKDRFYILISICG